jgi:decaprenylphospho-beta-D-ribofuranose 2-oxidase
LRRESRTLYGWGRIGGSRSRVLRPRDPAEAGRLVSGGSGVIARGLGRAYGDAAAIGGGLVLDATALAGIGPIRTDGGGATVDVGGGVSLGDLSRVAASAGWMLPVLPGTRHVTVGGAIAADVHGKNHHGDGGFGRYVRSFHLATADGDVAEVTREDEPALFAATLGGMGLTGVVCSARLELERLPSAYALARAVQTEDLDATMARLVEGDREHRYSVAWLDLATPGRRARGIVQHADLEPPEVMDDRRRARSRGRRRVAEPFRWRRGLVAPPLPGRGVVRATVVQALNSAYWMMPRPETTPVPLGRFLHPLDAVSGWPRLYGSAGFLQHQCAIPHGREDALRAVIEAFVGGPVTPALAVLKRLGPAGEGMLSFPIEGWTLAVDLPAADPAVYRLLDEVDSLVAEASGRVYLAKDARMRAEHMEAMYPRLGEWRAVKALVDPAHRFRSDLAERLGLVEPRGWRHA